MPYLLIAVGWSPAAPADTMAVSQVLYPSKAVCEDKGAEFTARLAAASDMPNAVFRFFCIEAPGEADYRNLSEAEK